MDGRNICLDGLMPFLPVLRVTKLRLFSLEHMSDTLGVM